MRDGGPNYYFSSSPGNQITWLLCNSICSALNAGLLCCLQMSAQAVARIMHGVASAAYPAAEWRKCGYWGRYSDINFAKVLKLAEEQLK